MFLQNLKLHLLAIWVAISFCFSNTGLCAAVTDDVMTHEAALPGSVAQRRLSEIALTALVQYEEWIRGTADNYAIPDSYGRIGAVHLVSLQQTLTALGARPLEFYNSLTAALRSNREFMGAAYIRPVLIRPTCIDRCRDIDPDQLDFGLKLFALASGITAYKLFSSSTVVCGDCFASHNITSTTSGCEACYQSDILPSAGTYSALAGLGALGGSVIASGWKLWCKPRALSIRILPDTHSQAEEAFKISTYVTLAKFRDITDHPGIEIAAMVRRAKNWIIDILNTQYRHERGVSLVRTILENIEDLNLSEVG